MRLWTIAKTILSAIGAGATLLLIALILWGLVSPPRQPERLSLRELEARAVAAAIRLYTNDHAGHWPPDLASLKPDYMGEKVDLERYVYWRPAPHSRAAGASMIALQKADESGLVIRIYSNGDVSKPDLD